MDCNICELAVIKEHGFFDNLCKNIFANVNSYSSWERFEHYTNRSREQVHTLINTFLQSSQELLGAHGYVFMDAERSKNEDLISAVLNENVQFTTRFMPSRGVEDENDIELQELEQFFFDTFSQEKLNAKKPLLAFQKQCRDVSRVIMSKKTNTFLLAYKPDSDGGILVTDPQGRKALLDNYRKKMETLLKIDETVVDAHFSGNKRQDTGMHLATITDAILQQVERTYV